MNLEFCNYRHLNWHNANKKELNTTCSYHFDLLNNFNYIVHQGRFLKYNDVVPLKFFALDPNIFLIVIESIWCNINTLHCNFQFYHLHAFFNIYLFPFEYHIVE